MPISRNDTAETSVSLCGSVLTDSRGSRCTIRAWFVSCSGSAPRSRAVSVSSSGAADAAVSPLRSRPTSISGRCVGSESGAMSSLRSGEAARWYTPSGSHSSGLTSAIVPANPSGVTPITV